MLQCGHFTEMLMVKLYNRPTGARYLKAVSEAAAQHTTTDNYRVGKFMQIGIFKCLLCKFGPFFSSTFWNIWHMKCLSTGNCCKVIKVQTGQIFLAYLLYTEVALSDGWQLPLPVNFCLSENCRPKSKIWCWKFTSSGNLAAKRILSTHALLCWKFLAIS